MGLSVVFFNNLLSQNRRIYGIGYFVICHLSQKCNNFSINNGHIQQIKVWLQMGHKNNDLIRYFTMSHENSISVVMLQFQI